MDKIWKHEKIPVQAIPPTTTVGASVAVTAVAPVTAVPPVPAVAPIAPAAAAAAAAAASSCFPVPSSSACRKQNTMRQTRQVVNTS